VPLEDTAEDEVGERRSNVDIKEHKDARRHVLDVQRDPSRAGPRIGALGRRVQAQRHTEFLRGSPERFVVVLVITQTGLGGHRDESADQAEVAAAP
jgi:hypothetical protein